MHLQGNNLIIYVDGVAVAAAKSLHRHDGGWQHRYCWQRTHKGIHADG